ncbi:hypothetical protein M758_2G185800 [Ceratodon purpureus]|nr:hypothetical protein M758_2G185800 [Ceratodon purpureus]
MLKDSANRRSQRRRLRTSTILQRLHEIYVAQGVKIATEVQMKYSANLVQRSIIIYFLLLLSLRRNALNLRIRLRSGHKVHKLQFRLCHVWC